MKRPTTPEELLALVDKKEAQKAKKTGGPAQGLDKIAEALDKAERTGLQTPEFINQEAQTYLLKVLRGKAKAKKLTSLGTWERVGPTIQERTDAAKTLLMYNKAKPTEPIKLDEPTTKVFAALSNATADKLLEIVRSEPKRAANGDS